MPEAKTPTTTSAPASTSTAVSTSGAGKGIAAFLFVSGMCALIYQVVWMRELRLVFGASTPATAAVLAVFMGGLGVGSHLLGKRADRVKRPFNMYAVLEAGIAISAALTPFLLMGARAIYVALGGSQTLGPAFGTIVRLLLSAIVLLPPTLLMGGTLPAAARAATHAADIGRVRTALLYGTNTLGAVTGAALSTFIMLEIFGTRLSLWLAATVNLLLAVLARVYDRRLAEAAPTPEVLEAEVIDDKEEAVAEKKAAPSSSRTVPTPFVLTAAAGVGLVFLLMELVWYRMLSPLLGGSSYTFGLILAVALFGIGIGGFLYTMRSAERPADLRGFALSCGLEAVFIGLPFALGDRVALMALFLRPTGVMGLLGHVLSWTVVTGVVVLPAAIVAGYQFPLLIALLGRARRSVGQHVGLAYAFNTLGAILGSLAGGFWLLPGLGCLGTWTLSLWILVILGVAAIALDVRVRPGFGRLVAPAVIVLVAPVLIHGAVGPTAVWRHSPIGAGRADEWLDGGTRNALRENMHERRRAITWEVDGRESTIGLYTLNDTAFLVNGKSDGAAVLDAGTQVMSGLLGAILHPGQVKHALVIGLGTGSTAGWLGALPDVERVDVVELEPAIVEVARACSAVNHDVLNNPKVNIIIGDGREVLLTTKERYDIIFSEPSNPYRAGVASLFTQEFYEAVQRRLKPDGIFAQWVQAYEADSISVRVVFSTLASVFPSVEAWRTKYSDLLLVNRAADAPVDLNLLRQRVGETPYKEALMNAWRVDSVEGVLARYVARADLARAIAAADGSGAINTDDRNMLEFAFARTLGKPMDPTIEGILATAGARGEGRPLLVGGDVDWNRVTDEALTQLPAEGTRPSEPAHLTLTQTQQDNIRALQAWWDDKYVTVRKQWKPGEFVPKNAVELMAFADAYAVAGEEEAAKPAIEQLARVMPGEADAIAARLYLAQAKPRESFDALERAFMRYRTDPWPSSRLMARVFPILSELVARDKTLADRAKLLLEQELAATALRYLRLELRLDLALSLRDKDLCRAALADFEPHRPWNEHFMRRRLSCLMLMGDPQALVAQEELAEFRADQETDFGIGLVPSGQPVGYAPPSPESLLSTLVSATPSASASAAPSAAPSGSTGPAKPTKTK